MKREPRVGDRVRVTSQVKGYQAGDKGTVTHAPKLPVHDEPYYVVAMDRDGPTCTAIRFTLREIELDEQP
jgi:hypothetical protein